MSGFLSLTFNFSHLLPGLGLDLYIFLHLHRLEGRHHFTPGRVRTMKIVCDIRRHRPTAHTVEEELGLDFGEVEHWIPFSVVSVITLWLLLVKGVGHLMFPLYTGKPKENHTCDNVCSLILTFDFQYCNTENQVLNIIKIYSWGTSSICLISLFFLNCCHTIWQGFL